MAESSGDGFNSHESREAFDFPIFESEPEVYAIVAIPRSGKTLLADSLWRTGRAGAPLEYFNERYVADYCRRWGALDTAGLTHRLKKHRTSPNGVFGFAVHWDHMVRRFMESGTPDFRPILTVSKYICVTRNDKVRQAISWARASQTDQWNTNMRSLGAPSYDRRLIAKCVRLTVECERIWERFFTYHKITPLRITYEQIYNDYEGTVRSVANFLNLKFDTVPTPRIEKQGDALSEEWLARFVRENSSPI